MAIKTKGVLWKRPGNKKWLVLRMTSRVRELGTTMAKVGGGNRLVRYWREAERSW